MPACVQIAPVDVGWQFQPEFPSRDLTVASPPPPPPIEAPAGSVIVAVICPVAAEPVSSTWKLTRPPSWE
jgi:hypothetical protein